MTSRRPHLRPHPPVLRLTGPPALLEAVPYLLGFHPESSLVLVGLHRERLVVTARIDLADLADAAHSRVLSDTLAAVQRGGASALVGVVYPRPGTTPGEDLPYSELAAALAAAAEAAGCRLLDVLLVAAGRWYSYTCTSADCCPRGGHPLPAGTSVVSAAATYAGLVALPDRAALAATLQPLAEADRARLAPALERYEHDTAQAILDGCAARFDRSVKRALFAAARAADGAPAEQLPDADQIARFGVALRSIGLRDSVWMAIDDSRLDGRVLWQQLARQLPSPYDAAPLFLFGWCSWRSGNGALAGIAAERAIASDPGYSAADLLLAALARGVDPRQLPRLRLPRPRLPRTA